MWISDQINWIISKRATLIFCKITSNQSIYCDEKDLLTCGCGSRVQSLVLGAFVGSSDLVSKNIMNSFFQHECRTPVLGNSHFKENWSAVIKQHQRKMKSLGIYDRKKLLFGDDIVDFLFTHKVLYITSIHIFPGYSKIVENYSSPFIYEK